MGTVILKGNAQRIRSLEAIGDIEFLIRPPDCFSFTSAHTALRLWWSFWLAVNFRLFCSGHSVGHCGRLFEDLLGVHYPGDIPAGACIGIPQCVSVLEIEALLPFSAPFDRPMAESIQAAGAAIFPDRY